MFQETETIKSFLYFRGELQGLEKLKKRHSEKMSYIYIGKWTFLARNFKNLYVSIDHTERENQKCHIFCLL